MANETTMNYPHLVQWCSTVFNPLGMKWLFLRTSQPPTSSLTVELSLKTCQWNQNSAPMPPSDILTAAGSWNVWIVSRALNGWVFMVGEPPKDREFHHPPMKKPDLKLLSSPHILVRRPGNNIAGPVWICLDNLDSYPQDPTSLPYLYDMYITYLLVYIKWHSW